MGLVSRIDLIFRGLVLTFLTAILAAGLAVYFRGNAAREPVEILLPAATTTPGEMLVYVSGAVAHEGTFTLKAGARVADAIGAAGGLSPKADRRQVNLAARAADGQHVHVASLDEMSPFSTPGTSQSTSPGASPGTSLLNMNTAGKAAIERLPGIGPIRRRPSSTIGKRTERLPVLRTCSTCPALAKG